MTRPRKLSRRQALAAGLMAPVSGGEMGGVVLDGGETLPADSIVFACGPWLGNVLP